MSTYKIEHNRLVIADEVQDQFVVAHYEFGCGLAYSKDTLIVFYDEGGVQTFAISEDTFKWLISQFFILDGFLYYGPDKLGKIDRDSIRGYTNLYVWDRSTVYYLNGPTEGANPLTFEDLGHFWARDDQKCFTHGRLIPDADAATFRVVAAETFAADKNRLYSFGGKVFAQDCPDPVPLGSNYFEIAGSVFCNSTRLPDADLATFRVLPVFTPEAKRAAWANGGPKDEIESMAIAGFTAYDCRHKYKGAWHQPPKRERKA